MKHAFIAEHRDRFPIKAMCRVFGLSRSGLYAACRRGRSARDGANDVLLAGIRAAHADSRQVYGAPRIQRELAAQGLACSLNRVKRLMQAHGIRARMRKRFRPAAQSSHLQPIAPNRLDNGFLVERPNQAWTSDITYLKTEEGWLYLAVVLDLYSRRVIGWATRARINTELVTAALVMALWHRKPSAGLVMHSDRGVQYASQDYRRLLADHGLVQSMSGKGNCYDNATMERFFASLKTERTYHRHYTSHEEAKRDVFDYIELFYNRVRRHSSLNYLSPVAFEKAWAK